ncbi:T-box protein VegT [Oryzias melastigma]|uniref:T-box protein VegT n=1 Tax=Oryzias melastigma TaxID=30732 RepID=UPI00168D9A69|nr:T-box protein VegT [Oryzias melastigma]
MHSISDFSLNASMPLSQSTAQTYLQGSIKVTLENAELWKSFHDIGTEMVITKHGRRMFPHCSIALSGLQPLANYVLMVDMIPVDGCKYKVLSFFSVFGLKTRLNLKARRCSAHSNCCISKLFTASCLCTPSWKPNQLASQMRRDAISRSSCSHHHLVT